MFELTTKHVISKFAEVWKEQICQIDALDSFDKYVVAFFYAGICSCFLNNKKKRM